MVKPLSFLAIVAIALLALSGSVAAEEACKSKNKGTPTTTPTGGEGTVQNNEVLPNLQGETYGQQQQTPANPGSNVMHDSGKGPSGPSQQQIPQDINSCKKNKGQQTPQDQGNVVPSYSNNPQEVKRYGTVHSVSEQGKQKKTEEECTKTPKPEAYTLPAPPKKTRKCYRMKIVQSQPKIQKVPGDCPTPENLILNTSDKQNQVGHQSDRGKTDDGYTDMSYEDQANAFY